MRTALAALLFAGLAIGQIQTGPGGSSGGGSTLPALTVSAPTCAKHGMTGTDGSISYYVVGHRSIQSGSGDLGTTAPSAVCTLSTIDFATISNTIVLPSDAGVANYDIAISASAFPMGGDYGFIAYAQVPGSTFTDTAGAGDELGSSPFSGAQVGYTPFVLTQGLRVIQSGVTVNSLIGSQFDLLTVTGSVAGTGVMSGTVNGINSQVTSTNSNVNAGLGLSLIGADTNAYNSGGGKLFILAGSYGSAINTSGDVTDYLAGVYSVVANPSSTNVAGEMAELFGTQSGDRGSNVGTYGVHTKGVSGQAGEVRGLYNNNMCPNGCVGATSVKSFEFEGNYGGQLDGWLEPGPHTLAEIVAFGIPDGSIVNCSDCKVTTVAAGVTTNSTCVTGGPGSPVFKLSGVLKCFNLP